MKYTIEQLTAKAACISGTQLVNLAWKAKSPQNAAKIAAFLGYPKNIVQAIRWAAIIAREERLGNVPKGTFLLQLGPFVYENIDLPDMVNQCFSFQIFCPVTNEWRSLNYSERTKVLKKIRSLTNEFGIKIISIISKKKNEPNSISQL